MARTRRSLHDYEPRTIVYVACYALLALVLALSYLLFVIWQRTISMLLVRVIQDKYATTGVYGVLVVLLVMALFIVVMASEYYFRHGVVRRALLPRFGVVAGTLFGIIGLGLAVQAVLIYLP